MTRVTGRWQIVEMDLWDRDAIDLLGPAFIEIGADGVGALRFIAVEGDIDGRHVERDGHPRWSSAGSVWTTTMTRPVADGHSSRRTTRSSVTSTSIEATTRASGRLPGGRPSNAPDLARRHRPVSPGRGTRPPARLVRERRPSITVRDDRTLPLPSRATGASSASPGRSERAPPTGPHPAPRGPHRSIGWRPPQSARGSRCVVSKSVSKRHTRPRRRP